MRGVREEKEAHAMLLIVKACLEDFRRSEDASERRDLLNEAFSALEILVGLRGTCCCSSFDGLFFAV